MPGAAPVRTVPFWTKVSYGIGAVAYGVKDNGFTVFLGFYYNQVVGVSPAAVGIIIACALVFDAVIDPVLGILSDRTRSRIGRRHPWLYASALPIAISWVMLWFPPEGSDALILGWLGLAAVLTRAAIASNEVPSLALAPELTQDYHERTLVLRYRFLFGWIGGLGMLMAAYGVFLQPPFGAPSGPAAQGGFQLYGIVGATLMAVTILISAWGTQAHVLRNPQPPVERMGLGDTLAAMRQTLRNRAFVILMASAVFGYIQQGIGFAVSQYLLTFIWQLSAAQFVLYTLTLIGAATLAFLISAPLSRRLGKPRAAACFALVGAAFHASPYILRLMGALPPAGSLGEFATFLPLNAMGTALGIGGMILGGSMMSDVVEASQEETGRREEGLFFSGLLFAQKCATGIGVAVVFLMLAAIDFPDQAVQGAVAETVLTRLTLFHIAILFLMSTLTALIVVRFPFGQAEHDARLARIAETRAGTSGDAS
ncbi:MAG: MFS transporter [Sphingopyxis sp.]|nr:MFS transporter [Sphingopyxis sp.]